MDWSTCRFADGHDTKGQGTGQARARASGLTVSPSDARMFHFDGGRETRQKTAGARPLSFSPSLALTWITYTGERACAQVRVSDICHRMSLESMCSATAWLGLPTTPISNWAQFFKQKKQLGENGEKPRWRRERVIDYDYQREIST